jgi:hypothetical protein
LSGGSKTVQKRSFWPFYPPDGILIISSVGTDSTCRFRHFYYEFACRNYIFDRFWAPEALFGPKSFASRQGSKIIIKSLGEDPQKICVGLGRRSKNKIFGVPKRTPNALQKLCVGLGRDKQSTINPYLNV